MTQVSIGQGLFVLPEYFASTAGRQVLVVTQPALERRYLPTLCHTLEQLGAKQVDYYLLPEGESAKTLAECEKIWHTLIAHQHYRDTTVIALGGGVVGDVAGFCAACYLRGVDFIQCPTTLLAQIDSAIGGKVGVNFVGKNMIGAFYPPKQVVVDIDTLLTLPERDFVASLGELIKYGLAFRADFLNWIEGNMSQLRQRDTAALQYAIETAIACKSLIVAQDEKEAGVRKLLNFGHTVGHALESASAYSLLHGEAVALGMLVAVQLSIQLEYIEPDVFDRVCRLYTQAGLPVQLPAALSIDAVMNSMHQDKKHRANYFSYILLEKVGQAFEARNVSTEQILSTLKLCGIGKESRDG